MIGQVKTEEATDVIAIGFVRGFPNHGAPNGMWEPVVRRGSGRKCGDGSESMTWDVARQIWKVLLFEALSPRLVFSSRFISLPMMHRSGKEQGTSLF